MTQFELDESRIVALAQAVRDDPLPDATDAAEVFARAAWTTLAEPGDALAGLLVGSLGAGAALRLILEAPSPQRLLTALTVAGLSPESELLGALDDAIQRWTPRLSSTDVIHSLEQAARSRIQLLVPSDRLWPSGVEDLGAHAPLALWWRGTPQALAALGYSIAVVGARAATGYGEHVALECAAGLVDRGFAVVSGAAYGIDGMAHRSALAGNGRTVAFLAGGVDRFYPSGHDALLTRIAEVGAVVSELPCGAAPTRWRFLQRNRLIAAASNATVVVEAGWRSGSLNTAGHAAALGRPLGAVPGPVTSPTSAGCHRLIREYDAVCVTSASEMAELVGGLEQASFVLSGGADDEARTGRTADQTRVLDAVGARSPCTPAELARQSGMSVAAVIAALGALELDGAISARESGWVRARGTLA